MYGRHILLVFLLIGSGGNFLNAEAARRSSPVHLLEQNVDDALHWKPTIIEAISDDVGDDANLPLRLPNNTRPWSYDIWLTTNVHRGEFDVSGRTRIVLDVLTANTRTITLHHRQLTIESVQLTLLSINGNTDEATMQLASHSYAGSNEQLTVRLATGEPDLLENRRYTLTIDHTGVLNSAVQGFHRASYVDNDGRVHWLASTHFEPTAARHAFPCYDEPALRARFTLTIQHGANYFALGNMPVVSSVESDDKQTRTTIFDETPPMSTYLIAFVVSDFDASEFNTNEATGVEHRIYARSQLMHKTALALETARRSTDAFEKVFAVNYTLPKMDQIAVPGFGTAMENWGLIIYNEGYLLYSESEDTFGDKYNVVRTIVHEIAHQWFGDLVATQWWEYTWMKEGFATLYEFHGTSWLFPEWRVLDTFGFRTLQSVMISDSTESTRPMSQYAESLAGVAGTFDSIGYGKAGSVLNMFLHAFTAEQWHRGLNVYLNRHAHSAANEDDLFAALQEQVVLRGGSGGDFTVANIMRSWTRQSGYPLVQVWIDYTTGRVTVQQQRYLSDPHASASSSDGWYIPYNLATSTSANFNDSQPDGWLLPSRASVIVELPTQPSATEILNGDWLLLNKRQTGYYRVQYDVQNYGRIAKALRRNPDDIHVASRSQLVDDLFDLASSERLGYDTVFDVIQYLEADTEYVPWASALRGLDYVHRVHSGGDNFEKYRAFVAKLISQLYDAAGLSTKPGEHFYRQHARSLAIRWACLYGYEACLVDTNTELQKVLNGTQRLHPDYRAAIMCAGARSADDHQYEQLWSQFSAHVDSNAARTQIIDTLACASRTDHLSMALGWTLDAVGHFDVATASERYRMLSALAGNRRALPLTLEVLAERFDEAVLRLGESNISAMVGVLARHVNNAELRAKFDALTAIVQASLPTSSEAIRNAYKVIEANDRWIQRNQQVIDKWISSTQSTASAFVSSLLLLLSTTVFVSARSL